MYRRQISTWSSIELSRCLSEEYRAQLAARSMLNLPHGRLTVADGRAAPPQRRYGGAGEVGVAVAGGCGALSGTTVDEPGLVGSVNGQEESGGAPEAVQRHASAEGLAGSVRQDVVDTIVGQGAPLGGDPEGVVFA